MIKYDDKGKLQVHLLSAKRVLPDRIIKEYDHKKVMKDMKNIMETLIDNYFYQVSYQEFLKYEVDENLEIVIVEDPNFKCRVLTDNYEADDTSFKYFKKSDYRKSIDLCELLLRRVKDSYNKLEEMERFIFYNNEISDEKEYTDESLCFEAGIHKDKYYGIKKSAYIKMAIQLGLTAEEEMSKIMADNLMDLNQKYILKTFSE